MESGQRHWGWGFHEQRPSREQIEQIARVAAERLGFQAQPVEDAVPVESADLRAPRVEPPELGGLRCSAATVDPATHAYGKAYRDIVKAFRGRYDNPPDFVAYPDSEQQIEQLLDWCAAR